jgi:hypothetical protein
MASERDAQFGAAWEEQLFPLIAFVDAVDAFDRLVALQLARPGLGRGDPFQNEFAQRSFGFAAINTFAGMLDLAMKTLLGK